MGAGGEGRLVWLVMDYHIGGELVRLVALVALVALATFGE